MGEICVLPYTVSLRFWVSVCLICMAASPSLYMRECVCMPTQICVWTYTKCAVQCKGKQRESAPRPPSTKSYKCVPRPTSGVQEQGAGLEGVQIGLMRFPSTPSACQGPSGFLPAYLECI